MRFQPLLLGIVVATDALAAGRGTPVRAIPYQGHLDHDGLPVTGPASLKFTLYDDAQAGTVLWEDTLPVAVVNGEFAVALGVTKPLPDPVFSAATLFAAISVEESGGSHPLDGRQPIYAAAQSVTTAGAPAGLRASAVDLVGAAGWPAAITLTNPGAAAIVYPDGNLVLGLHTDHQLYFGRLDNGFYALVVDGSTGNTTVAGNLTVSGIAGVTGNVSIGGGLTVTQNVTAGWVAAAGGIQGDTLTANSSTTTPVLTVTGAAAAGTLQVGSGSVVSKIAMGRVGCAGAALPASDTVGFGVSFSTAPRVFLQPRVTASGCTSVRITDVTPTSFSYNSWTGGNGSPCDCIDWLAIN